MAAVEVCQVPSWHRRPAPFRATGRRPQQSAATISKYCLGSSQSVKSHQLTGRRLRGGCSNGHRWTCARWLENNAETNVQAPLEHCWSLWEDQELIPNWMPWISSVKVLTEDRRMSRWTLSTYQFNRNWEFSWVARLLTPIKNQKIHWRSVEGSTGGSLGSGLEVANRGQIRFYPKGPNACSIKLTISYEVPDILAPFAGALTPLVENILRTDMQRFATYALEHPQKPSA